MPSACNKNAKQQFAGNCRHNLPDMIRVLFCTKNNNDLVIHTPYAYYLSLVLFYWPFVMIYIFEGVRRIQKRDSLDCWFFEFI